MGVSIGGTVLTMMAELLCLPSVSVPWAVNLVTAGGSGLKGGIGFGGTSWWHLIDRAGWCLQHT